MWPSTLERTSFYEKYYTVYYIQFCISQAGKQQSPEENFCSAPRPPAPRKWGGEPEIFLAGGGQKMFYSAHRNVIFLLRTLHGRRGDT